MTTNLIILDASGSMADNPSKLSEVKNGIEQVLRGIKKDYKAEKVLSRTILTSFSYSSRLLVDTARPQDLTPNKTAREYRPSGGTALIDAIVDGFNRVDPWTKDVFVTIITDGEENSSKRFNKEYLQNLIAYKKDTMQWNINFLGTTVEAINEAKSYGINEINTMSFQDNGIGVGQTFSTLNRTRGAYYSSRVAGNFTSMDGEMNKNMEEEKAKTS